MYCRIFDCSALRILCQNKRTLLLKGEWLITPRDLLKIWHILDYIAKTIKARDFILISKKY